MNKNLITSNFKYTLAKNIKETIASNTSHLYVFFGQSNEWEDENSPPELQNTLAQLNAVWSNILSLKKIFNSDISLAFRRITWTTDTVYDYYDDHSDLDDLSYYVITSNDEVWKCIDNNNGAASTDEPVQDTVPQLEILTTNDGYRWKYLFTIPEHLLRKFDSENYLPIFSNADVAAYATEGTIEKTNVIDPGAGYTASTEIPLFIDGDGVKNRSAIINITEVSAEGEILDFEFVNRGSTYTFGNDVTAVPVKISQAFDEIGNIEGVDFESAYGLATINTVSGEIADLEIVIPGKNYQVSSARLVQSSAYAYATVDSNGVIEDVTTVFAGSEFRQSNAVLVTDDEPSSSAFLRPIISPFFGHGGNTERELNINGVIFSVYTLFDENGDFTIDNDYRTVGVIRNPLSSVTNQPAIADSLLAQYTIELNDPIADEFITDELIAGVQSESEAYFIDYLDDYTLRYLKRGGSTDFKVGETIIGEDSETTSTIASITPPAVVPYSGEILMINNGIALERNQSQIESTTFIITF